MAANQENNIDMTNDSLSIRLNTANSYMDKNIVFNINEIGGGIDTSDATATNTDIVYGKSAYVNDEKIEGDLGRLRYICPNILSGQDLEINYNQTDSRISLTNNVYSNQLSLITEQYSGSNAGYVKSGNDIITIGANVFFPTDSSYFGDATPEDVAAGKTFTSSDGYKLQGTATFTEESSGMIDIRNTNPPGSAIAVSFTNVSEEPEWFIMSIRDTGLSKESGYSRCINAVFDGSTVKGNSLGSNLTFSNTYYTKSYSNNTFTVTSSSPQNGGYMHHDTNGYRFIYGTGGSLKKKNFTISSDKKTLTVTGLTKEPTIFALISTASSSSTTITDIIFDGTTLYGNYISTTGNYSESYYTKTYNNGTLTLSVGSNGGTFAADSYEFYYSNGILNNSSGGGSSSSINIGTATLSLSSDGTSLAFAGLKGEPKVWNVEANATFTAATNKNYTTGITFDGTSCIGNYINYTSSYMSATVRSNQSTDYSGTYSGTTLTVASTGSTTKQFKSGTSYKLTYIY